MSLKNELDRGELARRILDSQLYQEAVAEVEKSIINKWKSCPVRDIDGQHELKLMHKVLFEVTRYIETVLETGKMAEIQTQQEKKMELLRQKGIPA